MPGALGILGRPPGLASARASEKCGLFHPTPADASSLLGFPSGHLHSSHLSPWSSLPHAVMRTWGEGIRHPPFNPRGQEVGSRAPLPTHPHQLWSTDGSTGAWGLQRACPRAKQRMRCGLNQTPVLLHPPFTRQQPLWAQLWSRGHFGHRF